MKTHAALLSSESAEWYTPLNIMKLVYKVMTVDLDPCSNSDKQIIAKSHCIGLNGDDGLIIPWTGSVYMNPPFGKTGSKSTAGIWCDKLISENPNESIVLIKAATDTAYFHKMAAYADVTLLVKGRIQFIPSKEKSNNNNGSTIPNAIFYKGCNVEKFIQVFAHKGLLCEYKSYQEGE